MTEPAEPFPPPWSDSTRFMRSPRVRGLGCGSGYPVLLHHGFLIDRNLLWRRAGTIDALVLSGRRVLLIEEHFLRDIDGAHALGHDASLPLGEALSAALDVAGPASIDVIASGAGVAPALILAMNDPRVRRLVLCDPSPINLPATPGAPIELAEPTGPTETEIDLGVECDHVRIAPARPARGVELQPGRCRVPILLVSAGGQPLAGEAWRDRLPDAELVSLDDDSPSPYDPRFPDLVRSFFS
jgi:pimeloyl-ACP methyl ester carboxylesterase